jgi:hypothetical protein
MIYCFVVLCVVDLLPFFVCIQINCSAAKASICGYKTLQSNVNNQVSYETTNESSWSETDGKEHKIVVQLQHTKMK